jgi:membrane protein DedA with SNARE-associated domain/rhodanese-related sulfurtransferase
LGPALDLIGVIAQHGYAMTAVVLFLAALGFPLPVAVTLLVAGAAAHHGLQPAVVLAIAWSAAMMGDVLLFLGGKFTGWWLLSGICRLSLNPEQCIFTSANSFYRRGPLTLIIAKFIPGLATVAAPLAGSLHMPVRKFLWLMAVGEALYCGAWVAAGFVFYRFIGAITGWIEGFGHALLLVLLVLASGYGLIVLFLTLRSRRFRSIEKITAESLQERLKTLEPDRLVVIADVRSHNYYDSGMQRIKNSIRVEPNRLQEELEALKEFMAPECEVYLYCSCIRDTTSVRVAHALRQADLRATVIEGGMKAWARAGGEMELVPEGDVRHLPRFD